MNKSRDPSIDGVLLGVATGRGGLLVQKMLLGLLVPILTPAAHLLLLGHWLGVAAIDLAALPLLARA